MATSNKNLTYEQALFKASAYCATSEHCESEIREKLRAWDIVPQDADKIIAYLKQENYLDENRFCEAFVRDKFRFNSWGKMKIGMMLRVKNVSKDTINEALETIDEEVYAEKLTAVLKTKAKGLKFRDSYDRQAKLIRFAQGRGFEFDAIMATIKKL